MALAQRLLPSIAARQQEAGLRRLAIGLLSLVAATGASHAVSLAVPAGMEAQRRACTVFCEGPLLHAVQTAGLFPDSKKFVDMPLLRDPEDVLAAFEELKDRDDPEVLREFIRSHFAEEGHELEPWQPPDFVVAPPKLASIQNEDMRKWALELNDLWKLLSRRQSPAVAEHPQRYSALARRFGMVVPGGRFRETYYWDTYWIVRGLLVCDMVETARGVVGNLLDDVRNLGFVPNGGRVYYLDRSQPPLLTDMVLAVYEAAPNKTWLEESLPALEQEYNFWMDPARGHVYTLGEDSGRLNVYRSSASTPRPESYKEDFATASKAEQSLGRSKEEVYNQLRSGAESGWDFSSRWLDAGIGASGKEGTALGSIKTSSVVPVDLNSFLYRVELGLAKAHSLLGTTAAAANYEAAAARRAEAMGKLLWDEGRASFRDWRSDAEGGKGAASAVTSISDYALPLWAGLLQGQRAEQALGSLRQSGLLQEGGAATTVLRTGEQWDAPNAWAPLQLMLIEGLQALKTSGGAEELGTTLASTWLNNCYLTWQRTGHMQEKYDAGEPGKSGGGGEYEPQIGFGWSNGVVLVLLTQPAPNAIVM